MQANEDEALGVSGKHKYAHSPTQSYLPPQPNGNGHRSALTSTGKGMRGGTHRVLGDMDTTPIWWGTRRTCCDQCLKLELGW